MVLVDWLLHVAEYVAVHLGFGSSHGLPHLLFRLLLLDVLSFSWVVDDFVNAMVILLYQTVFKDLFESAILVLHLLFFLLAFFQCLF
jgi:hypothetical protein